MYLTQTSKIFRPDLIEQNEPIKMEDVEEVKIDVEDGLFLRGVYKKSKNSDAPIIIYFGGNADDATRIVEHLKGLNDFDIVAFNYRGFVNSDGKPSEDTLFGDALKIYEKFKKDKTIIMGRSLGSGVATFVASKRRLDGLILITPYDSILSIAQKKYPYLPICLLLKHKFESTKYIKNVTAPVGLIEVKFDDVIPKYHFEKLKKRVSNLALHVVFEDCTHGSVLEHSDFEKTISKMLKMFRIGM